MNKKVERKKIWQFILLCIPISNILWFIAYSQLAKDKENIISALLMTLTQFLPAIIALILCKVNKDNWKDLPIYPNIKKAWKIYLMAIPFTWILVYLNDPLVLMIFKGNVSYSLAGMSFAGWSEVLIFSLLSIPGSIEMLGEELGWLGYLFPKLEKLHGTIMAILQIALIRTSWHLGILVFLPHPIINIINLFISNLLTQSFLIYLVKKSKSLLPAGMVHIMTILFPIFLVYTDEWYYNNIIPMCLVELFSGVIIGTYFLYKLYKEKLIIKRGCCKIDE